MLYFKKQNHFYCKFDPLTFTFFEVLSGIDQARIVTITNEELYNQTYQRIQQHEFEVTTAQEFSEFLSFVINRINQQEQ